MSEAITREEQYLNAIANGEGTDLKPITREEMFLAKASGQSIVTPPPITRKEMFLSKISGGSSGDESGKPISVYYASQMDTILTNATVSDIGKAYLYSGETTEAYENNAIYIIKEKE